ncbi:hypothetical protein F4V43_03130 [Paenibacillus spiritus]|uniref:DUF2207 domain-containing protein n=1 Tax=Paenibacillus spiritus TaxID=2496557 RepID=A0A5J5GHD7_9BACL|nr:MULTISPECIES: SA1362 family protein [Paenibacillus]KAA9007497.1 hypothetical protein F4V43_03130 [Paenibacillus spiritus]
MKKHAAVFWTTITLAAIGLIAGLVNNPYDLLRALLIPAVLTAVLFLLYKYPPRRYAGGRSSKIKVKPSQKTMAKMAGIRKTSAPTKRKSYPFQVIEGSKGKNDEQLPKYH